MDEDEELSDNTGEAYERDVKSLYEDEEEDE